MTYIIMSERPSGERVYWTGTSNKYGGWSVFSSRAHEYKSAKAAASAIQRGKARKQGKMRSWVWKEAQFVSTDHPWL